MRKISLAVAVAIASTGLFVAGTAAAANSPATGSFNVTAHVQGSCRVTSTSDIAFGTYDPADANASTPLDQNGSVPVRCVKGIADTVAHDPDQNGSGTCAPPAGAAQAAPNSDPPDRTH